MQRALHTIYRLRRVVALNFLLIVLAGGVFWSVRYHVTGQLGFDHRDAISAGLLLLAFLSIVVTIVLWPVAARDSLSSALAFAMVIAVVPLWRNFDFLDGSRLRFGVAVLVLIWIVGYGIKRIAKLVGQVTLPRPVKTYAEVDVDLPPEKVFDGMRLEESLPEIYGDDVAKDAVGGFTVTRSDGAQMRTRQTADPSAYELVERTTATVVPGLDITAITTVVPRGEGSSLQITEICEGMPLWLRWAMWVEDMSQDSANDHRDRLEGRPRLGLLHRVNRRLFAGVPD